MTDNTTERIFNEAKRLLAVKEKEEEAREVVELFAKSEETNVLFSKCIDCIKDDPEITLTKLCEKLGAPENRVMFNMGLVLGGKKSVMGPGDFETKKRRILENRSKELAREKSKEHIFMCLREKRKEKARQFMSAKGNALLNILKQESPLSNTEIQKRLNNPRRVWGGVRLDLFELDNAMRELQYGYGVTCKCAGEDDLLWTLTPI